MKKVIVSLIIFVSTSAMAYSCRNPAPTKLRAAAWRMTCEEAQSLLSKEGSVVFFETPGIYDRHVSSECGCSFGTDASSSSIATKDTGNCDLGLVCLYHYPN